MQCTALSAMRWRRGNLHLWPELQIIHRSLCFPIFTHFSTSHSSSFSFLHTFLHQTPQFYLSTFYHTKSLPLWDIGVMWCSAQSYSTEKIQKLRPKITWSRQICRKEFAASRNSAEICTRLSFSISEPVTSFPPPSCLSTLLNTFSVVNTNVIIALNTLTSLSVSLWPGMAFNGS